jgi:TPR repeat protein
VKRFTSIVARDWSNALLRPHCCASRSNLSVHPIVGLGKHALCSPLPPIAQESVRVMKSQIKARSSKLYEQALVIAQGEKPDFRKALSLLQRAHKAKDPRAAYALATWYLHGKAGNVEIDFSKAVPLLQEAADANLSDAQYDLAVCYEKGVGARVNLKKAAALYLRAALHGDRQAAYETGRCYYHAIGVKQDRSIAAVWFSYAEELGIVD